MSMRSMMTALAALAVAPAAFAACPCSNPAMCAPIHVPPRQEIFGFQVVSTNWPYYNYSSITTIAAFGGIDPGMLCKAHEANVKISVLAPFPAAQLLNESYIEAFIAGQVAAAQAGYYDGINFDFEDPLNASSPQVAALTSVVNRTTLALKASIGADFQVSLDVAWSPSCIDGRCYDYPSLCAIVDLCFIMAYDMRSQVFWPAPCIASANSPLPLVAAGVNNFTAMGIPADKLILGVPWYAYDYVCIDDPSPTQVVCTIQRVTWRGVNCSDAVGSEIDFRVVNTLITHNATTPVTWNASLSAYFFNYVDASTGAVHQVWYDEPRSLTLKYELATSLGLRGVGTWELDALDYTSTDPVVMNQTASMWEAISAFRSRVA